MSVFTHNVAEESCFVSSHNILKNPQTTKNAAFLWACVQLACDELIT